MFVCFKMRSILGFTLLELMVVVLILGIIVTGGSQIYGQLIEQTRATTAINELFYQLAYARSEAIKRNSPVTFCASQNATTCSNEKYQRNWSGGYIFFEDKNDDKQKQKTEQLLGAQSKIYPNDKLYYNSSATGYGALQFSPLEYISENASSFLYCPSGEKTHAKAIFLTRIGRPRIGPPKKEHHCGN